ncbi:MAG: LacI family DNA-binding transcriptional regulator [Oscillospiraceae bacterium]|nr:LacI family DNA-binding transcriptional regulator [Oscillospiraceae bacterium]
MNIYDIANKSHVSIATVSRVINGSSNVSPETRGKVLRTIQEADYTPNAFARGLGLNTMKQIGILVSDVSDTCYANEVAVLESSLQAAGFDVILKCTGTKLKSKRMMLNAMLECHVDAVILVGSIMQELKGNSHIKAAAKKIPVIIINGYVKGKNIVNVRCNEKDGVQDCVHDMCHSGCQHLLLIYDHLTFSCKQKLAGFQSGLLECKNYDPSPTGEAVCISGNFDEIVIGAVQYLHNKSVDGIIGADDRVAVAVQKAMLRLGLSIPLVGMNNSILAKAATPSISSIDNMSETLCTIAVKNLLDVFQGKHVPCDTVVSSEFVERESFIRKNGE